MERLCEHLSKDNYAPKEYIACILQICMNYCPDFPLIYHVNDLRVDNEACNSGFSRQTIRNPLDFVMHFCPSSTILAKIFQPTLVFL